MTNPIRRDLSSSQVSDWFTGKSNLPIPARGGSIPYSRTSWVRNKEWATLPTVGPTDQKFAGLLAITNDDSNFIAINCAANYTIDWGDGTSTENISSGVQANHLYSYSAAGLANSNAPVTFTDAGDLVGRVAHGHSNGDMVRFYSIASTTGLTEAQYYYVINKSADSFQVSATVNGSAVTLTTDGTGALLPYKQAIVTVIPNGGNLTTVNLQVKHSQTGLQSYNAQWLDITVGSPNLTTLTIGTSALTVYLDWLEQVTIISHGKTSFSGQFRNCSSLQSVPLFNTAGVTSSMDSMFYSCYSLQSVPMFNTVGVTNMANMFQDC